MATTQNTYTGDGSTTAFSFTFPYLETTDIKVSLDAVDTTAYTLSNATTISFTTAPTSGAAIRIYRNTDTDNLKATFFPGSAIKASDLNNNFTQNLYVTQEADFDVDTANTTANTAKTTADTAIATANTATTTANSATSTANTAATNASAAVTTANAASASATTALNNSRESDGSGGFTSAIDKATAATTTANTALTNSRESDGSGGYNSAIDKANTALTTANSASTSATSAVSTANTASTNATNALNTANAASAAVSNAVLFTLVANVAAIPGSPSNNDYIEIGDSSGIQSFTPLSGLPSGFVGASGLTVRLRYDSSSTSWVWMSYFANDSEDRYLTKSLPVVVGDATNGSGQITLNCENNSHGVKIKGPPHSAAANYTLTLPTNTGSNGNVLKTDGSGTTSWDSADVVADTTPQLGGDLDCNANNITNTVLITGSTPSLRGSGTNRSASLSNYDNSASGVDSELRLQPTRLDLYYGTSSHLSMDQNGDFTINNSVGGTRGIAFYGGSTNNYLTIRPPTSFTATTYTLPAADGSSGQAIVTNGSGVLSFADAGAPTIDGGNFDTGGSLVTTSNTIDGGSFD